jgi:acyl-coenzyme A thioesterase PaaI-like protein
MTAADIDRFLRAEFSQHYNAASGLSIIEAGHAFCRVRQDYREAFVRPGGTLSGPTMMALADFGMYVAVLATIGPVPLAVTINLNINFLRRPAPRALIG